MSEEERKAKAARARELLKQRQKKKVTEGVGSTSPATASPSVSRPGTPAVASAAPTPALPAAHASQNDIESLFGESASSDSSWLNSLTPVETPTSGPTSVSQASSPPPLAPSPLRSSGEHSTHPFIAAPRSTSPRHASFGTASPLANGSAHDARVQELLQALQQREHTIDALQAEKAALEGSAREADQLKSVVTRATSTLQEERHKTNALRARVQELVPQSNELREVKLTLVGLQAENASLALDIQRLQAIQSDAHAAQDLLAGERTRSTILEQQVAALQSQADEVLHLRQYITDLKSQNLALSGDLAKLEVERTKASHQEEELAVERSKIRDLKVRIQGQDEELRSMESLRKNLSDAQEGFLRQQAAYDAERSQVKILSERVHTQSEKLEELSRIQQELLEAQAHVAGQREQITAQQAQMQEMEERAHTQGDALAAVATLEQTVSDLRIQLDASRADTNTERSEVQQLKADAQAVESKLAQLSELRDQVSTLESKADNMLAQLQSEQAKSSALQQRLAQSDSESADLGKLEAQVAALTSTAQSRASELEALRVKTSAVSLELKEATDRLEEIPSLQIAVSRAESDAAEAKQSLAKALAQVKEMEARLEATEEQAAELPKTKKSLATAESKAKKLQSLLDAERVKSQKVEDRAQAAENRVAELSGLEAVLSTRDHEQEGLRKEISELHDELSRTRVRADGMETQVVQLHDLRDTVTTLESQLLERNTALEGERTKLQQVVSRLQDADAQLADLSKLQQSLKSAEAKAKKNSTLLDAERVKIGKIEGRLREASDQLQELPVLHARIASLTEVQSANAAVIQELRAIESNARETELALSQKDAGYDALERRVEDLQTQVRDVDNLNRTISLLVNEKASLSASLDQLATVESRLAESNKSLDLERSQQAILQARVEQIQSEAQESARRFTESSARDAAILEQKERELQLSNNEIDGLRKEATRHRARARELEEQIENDDTAERLQASLKNAQDRTDELEFKLGKLQQSHTTLKKERDDLHERQQQRASTEGQLQAQHDALQSKHQHIETELRAVTQQRADLAEEKEALQSRASSSQQALAELEQRLSQVASELAHNSRQLQTSQAELRQAIRRAEESERIQRDLHAESSGLVQSLGEMRPKLVELTNDKLELSENVGALQAALRSGEDVIADLEYSIQQLQDDKANLERREGDLTAQTAQEQIAVQQDLASLQTAYEELQNKLADAQASSRTIESQRASDAQSLARLQNEASTRKALLRTKDEKFHSLQAELEEHRRAVAEQREFLEGAQSEIEVLRLDLVSRDDEIQHLRQSLTSQDELDHSTAQSHIRSLESKIFEAEARAHTLQRQLNSREEELARLRSAGTNGRAHARPFSPPSRSVSRGDSRRSSLGPRRPSGGISQAPRPSPDYSMSPEMRQKRAEALRLLKARMDSEKSSSIGVTSHRGEEGHTLGPIRPHFLDEGHIFWCHACSGDLVIL